MLLSQMLTRTWSLPKPRYKITVDRGLRVPMSDGVELIADHYRPACEDRKATVLVRCPYGRGIPYSAICGELIAQQGYHVLLQSCRGTFGSGGAFEPFRNEAADGLDTVAWLREQDWFSGRFASYGMSYLGFVQWALAMDPPPELAAMLVHIGPHDFAAHMYRNGAFDLHTYLGWSYTAARQEEVGPLRSLIRVATAERSLRPAFDRLPLASSAHDLLGDRAPWFAQWLGHPDTADPYWAPLQCGAALSKVSVPTLIVGGWQDLFLEQSIEQYRSLADRDVPVKLLIGPWAHLELATKGAAAMIESLAWLDTHLGTVSDGAPKASEPTNTVRIWVDGSGWRELPDWPVPGSTPQRWYLHTGGALATEPPGADAPAACFRYDPADPTPTTGGAILSRAAGARDNAQVERRGDVLVFTSAPLDAPAEVIGEVAAELSVARDNASADLFVRLCDVDPGGRSRNVCDGIVRLTERDPLTGTIRISLVGAAHQFGRGHRIRLQVAGGAYPHFNRNPGTGGVDAGAADLVSTEYRIGVDAAAGSALILPVAGDDPGPAG